MSFRCLQARRIRPFSLLPTPQTSLSTLFLQNTPLPCIEHYDRVMKSILMLPRNPRLGRTEFFRSRLTCRRTMIAAPKPGSGPLMSRRADRELPSITNSRRWLYSIPIFALIMGFSTAAIFNYQKSSSSVVSSALYSLRTNPQARELLGDEIYFASKFPWIKGEMNQLHGRINIRFWVKGTRQMALMRFKSERKYRMGYVCAFMEPAEHSG